jgi:hypothetical protein
MNTAGRLPFLLQQFFTKRLVAIESLSNSCSGSYTKNGAGNRFN